MKARVKATGEIILAFAIVGGWYGSDGKEYQPDELEFLPDNPNEVTIVGWVARDRNGDLSLYRTYPERQENLGYWRDGDGESELPNNSFPEITWESEPIKVCLTITQIEL